MQPDARFQREGDNLVVEKNIDLYTTVLGGKIEAPTMTGNVKLTMPESSETGAILRLRGKGMPKYGRAGQFGDLLVKLNVRLPKDLTLEEEQLFRKLQALRETANVKMNGR